MGQAKILPFRQSEEEQIEISDGIREWEEQRRREHRISEVGQTPMIDPGYKDRNKPQTWAEWYDEHYMDLYEGIFPAIAFIVLFTLLLTVSVNVARAWGWWQQ